MIRACGTALQLDQAVQLPVHRPMAEDTVPRRKSSPSRRCDPCLPQVLINITHHISITRGPRKLPASPPVPPRLLLRWLQPKLPPARGMSLQSRVTSDLWMPMMTTRVLANTKPTARTATDLRTRATGDPLRQIGNLSPLGVQQLRAVAMLHRPGSSVAGVPQLDARNRDGLTNPTDLRKQRTIRCQFLPSRNHLSTNNQRRHWRYRRLRHQLL